MSKVQDFNENARSLRNFLGFKNYLIIDLLYSCGLRAQELADLTINNINLSANQILINGKGSKD
ncbi:MAG: tyrosine-type recombinase/integrase, partial [Candidatus Phytoplasma australasiaticum]|nr:tyrosine-type recombinase/integrase [Candidatus Phytoplasma australasiaticum]